MTALKLELLGEFRLSRAGAADLDGLGRKPQALLAYLALHTGRKQSRDRLATLLWGDRFDEQARHSLRQCVLTLRKALDDEAAQILVSDDDALLLDSEAVQSDVLAFERSAAGQTREDLERAAALYRGDLLDGFSVKEQEFDDWLAAERGRLRALAADVLARLTEIYANAAETDAAIAAAERLVELEPLREDAHRALIRLYDEAGRRSAALHQYRVLRDALRRELQAEPEPETERLYSEIRTGEAAGAASTPDAGAGKPLRHRWLWLGAPVLGVLLIAAGVLWMVLQPDAAAPIAAADERRLAFPLPEKPSIVVLPFENLGGEPANATFAESLTEEITTVLSMISNMFVISRNTANVYKGRNVKPSQAAEELGVRYVLEGSVKRSGDRVRISARLADAVDGQQLWAKRYEREASDVFAIQDAITLDIVTALEVEITEGEQERISLIHGTDNLQAWILVGQALMLARRLTREDNAKARRLHLQAAELDPNYPGAFDGLAWTHFIDAKFGWSDSPEASIRRAAELGQKALALDPMRGRTYSLLGAVMLTAGDHAEAVALGEKAVALHPSGSEVAAFLALTLTYAGEPERAVALLQRAMRLSPYYPEWYRWNLGRSLRLLGRYDEAIDALGLRTVDSSDSLAPHVELAAAYAAMGQVGKAGREAAEVLRIDPGFSARAWLSVPPYKDPAVTDRELALLKQAGLGQ